MHKNTQKLIYKWDELEDKFKEALDHYCNRVGHISKMSFLKYLIRHGCKLELKRKKTEGKKEDEVD